MKQEKIDYLIRTVGLISLLAFPFLLISGNLTTTWMTIYGVFMTGLAIYQLSRQQNSNRWINVSVFLAVIMGIFGYMYFANLL